MCAVEFTAGQPFAKWCSRQCKDRAAWLRRHPIEAGRECPVCQGSLDGMRSHAVYCSRSCKGVAASRRQAEKNPTLNKDRYQREKERRKEYAKLYSRKNLAVGVVRRRNRKDRIRSNAGYTPFDPAEWARLVNRFNNCCAYCGTSGPLQMDHVVPLSRGGRHAIANILPACAACNYSKHTSLLSEWRYLKGGGSHLIPDCDWPDLAEVQ